jgi:hypothetical protein
MLQPCGNGPEPQAFSLQSLATHPRAALAKRACPGLASSALTVRMLSLRVDGEGAHSCHEPPQFLLLVEAKKE